jgi:hypothetical protein
VGRKEEHIQWGGASLILFFAEFFRSFFSNPSLFCGVLSFVFLQFLGSSRSLKEGKKEGYQGRKGGKGGKGFKKGRKGGRATRKGGRGGIKKERKIGRKIGRKRGG